MATLFDTVAKFRANSALITAIAEKARREGRTQSEVIRGALRRELEDAR